MLACRAEAQAGHHARPGIARVERQGVLRMAGRLAVGAGALLRPEMKRRPPRRPAQQRVCPRIARLHRDGAPEQSLRLLVLSALHLDRKSVVMGESGSVRVDLGGVGYLKKKQKITI